MREGISQKALRGKLVEQLPKEGTMQEFLDSKVLSN